MEENNSLSAYIIAGGKSKRFKEDKSLYIFNEKPLIQHVFDAIKPVIPNITIIADDTEKFKFLEVETLPDIIPDMGPIGGLYTALEHANGGNIFAFGCDMPSLNSDFIEYMTTLSMQYDMVIPMIGNKYEPLHAIYSHNCLKFIKESIDNKQKKILNFLDKVEVRKITEAEIEYYDDPLYIFRNINYTDDVGNV